MAKLKTKRKRLKFQISCKRYEYKRLVSKRGEAWRDFEITDKWYKATTPWASSWTEDDLRIFHKAQHKADLASLLIHPYDKLRKLAQFKYKEFECLEQIEELRKGYYA